jgi:acyl dehydratase
MRESRVTVGYRTRPTRTLTACDIEFFTDPTGDRNPVHHDEVRAADADSAWLPTGSTPTLLRQVRSMGRAR